MGSNTSSLSRRSFLQGVGAVGLASAGATLMAMAAGERDVAFARESGSVALPGEKDIYTDIFTVPTRNVPVLNDPSYMTRRGVIAFEDRDIADSEIVRTEEADVVVVGLGISGICAVLAAAEAGATVYGLEKMNKPRAVFETLGVAGAGSIMEAAMAEAGVEATPIAYMTDVLLAADYRVNAGPARLWATKSGEAADWLQGMLDQGDMNIKIVLNERAFAGTAHPTELGFSSDVFTEMSKSNAGAAALYVVPDLATAAKKFTGVTLAYDSPAVQLTTSGDGVTGVIAKDANGYFRINAKSVVMATGGYDCNPDMLKAWCRNEDIAGASSWNPCAGSTGDGHMMGLRVGASMDPIPHAVMNFTSGNPDSYYGTSTGMAAPLAAGFMVNQDGQRFCNESLALHYRGNAFSAQKDCGKHIWSICDATMFPDTEEMNRVLAKYIGVGYIKKADTIEDLAKQMEVPADSLAATTEQYNGFVETGDDTEFGRPMAGRKPVVEAPFYAVLNNQTILTTVSGLIVDVDTHVLDWSQDPIPGFYAVGNCSGGMMYGNYPRDIGGLSIGRAVTFGMTAGRNAAKGE